MKTATLTSPHTQNGKNTHLLSLKSIWKGGRQQNPDSSGVAFACVIVLGDIWREPASLVHFQCISRAVFHSVGHPIRVVCWKLQYLSCCFPMTKGVGTACLCHTEERKVIFSKKHYQSPANLWGRESFLETLILPYRKVDTSFA